MAAALIATTWTADFAADAPRVEMRRATPEAVEACAFASVEDFYEKEGRRLAGTDEDKKAAGKPAQTSHPRAAASRPESLVLIPAGKPAEDAASAVANTFPSLIVAKRSLDKISPPPLGSQTQASPGSLAGGSDGSIYNGMFDKNTRPADAPVAVQPPR